MTTSNNKQIFWVEENGKPQLVEGVLIPEEDDDWCPGALRLHVKTPKSHRVYPFYFNTQEELIEHEIKMLEFEIDFEKELLESKTETLQKDKEHWSNMLALLRANKP